MIFKSVDASVRHRNSDFCLHFWF